MLARFLVSRETGGREMRIECNYGGKKVRNMRDKWIGEWPTKFWKRVKSGSCLFARMKKRILSRRGEMLVA